MQRLRDFSQKKSCWTFLKSVFLGLFTWNHPQPNIVICIVVIIIQLPVVKYSCIRLFYHMPKSGFRQFSCNQKLNQIYVFFCRKFFFNWNHDCVKFGTFRRSGLNVITYISLQIPSIEKCGCVCGYLLYRQCLNSIIIVQGHWRYQICTKCFKGSTSSSTSTSTSTSTLVQYQILENNTAPNLPNG